MSSIKKVLVMNAPSGVYCRDDRCQDRIDEFLEPVYRTPLEILYQAALLKQLGIEFLVRDYSLEHKTWNHLKQDIESFKPTHIVFNITTPSLKGDLTTCDVAKSVDRNIVTIARGLHFAVKNKTIFEQYPNLDVAIIGEFEKTFIQYFKDEELEKLDGVVFRQGENIVFRPQGAGIEDLDSIPFPLRECIDNRLFRRPDTGELETTVRVSRGCPFPCTYCLAPLSAGKKIRYRSPENIIAEMRECKEKYGIKNFLLRSDLFSANRAWVYDFCDKLADSQLNVNWSCNSRADTIDPEKLKRMKRAGCWLLSLGVESEGAREIEQTINFAIKIDPDFAHFSPLYPYPGTEFYDVVTKEGLLKSDDDLHPYALVKPVVPTHYLSIEEINRYFVRAWRRFHLRPRYIMKTFLRARSPKVMYSYARYGTKLVGKMINRRVTAGQ
ncbi:MAG: radical SAM protein [Deltaproteobacteria bacterium]|nr:radical SAM protein [Deltaproteobacteria bacterium]